MESGGLQSGGAGAGHKKSDTIEQLSTYAMLFAAIWMDLEMVILSEVRHRKTKIIWDCLYVQSFKKGSKEIIYKTKRIILYCSTVD